MPDFYYEKKYWEKGEIVAGVDEAGRGCLAGPVVAAAAILPQDLPDLGINDSKLLNSKKREKIFEIISEYSIIFAIGIVDNFEIDKINILRATVKAMNLALNGLSLHPNSAIIDGNHFKSDSDIKAITIIKGDQKSLSIALASIIAKVTRDKYMSDIAHAKYPQYDFAQHKGYGTAKHIAAIKEFGVCEIHRNTFLNKILSDNEPLF